MTTRRCTKEEPQYGWYYTAPIVASIGSPVTVKSMDTSTAASLDAWTVDEFMSTVASNTLEEVSCSSMVWVVVGESVVVRRVLATRS